MKELNLLNELEQKMVASLERERENNAESKKSIQESIKLSEIEEKVKNVINLLEQLEQS